MKTPTHTAARRELAERVVDVILPARLPAAERLVESLEQTEALANLLASAAEIDAGGYHHLSADHVQAVCRSIEREAKIARHLLELVETPAATAPAPCTDPLSLLARTYFNLSASQHETLKIFIETWHGGDSQRALNDLIQRGLCDVVHEGADEEVER
ncbi:MAG: hypothetical protein MZV65_16365 [Chromatiales bacterium]|nr:hypothetical protein [Chromatiales bacterium]